jgi:hypothetical protein
MELHRFGVKIFADASSSVPLRDFVPVFHGWIQKQIVKDHLLIDVHDYSHIYQGPGILLVAHEGNFSMDMSDGRLGLFYYRKQPVGGSPEERLATIMQTTIQGCRLLEEEPGLAGKLRFPKDDLLVIANDRLQAPNENETFAEFQPIVTGVLQRVFGETNFDVAPVRGDPKERFAVHIRGRF